MAQTIDKKIQEKFVDNFLKSVETPPGKSTRPRCTWMLEQRDRATIEFFKGFVPNKEPFVYTT